MPDIDAGPGVAIRKFSLRRGFHEADYLLFANRQAVGVVEAKKRGFRSNQEGPHISLCSNNPPMTSLAAVNHLGTQAFCEPRLN